MSRPRVLPSIPCYSRLPPTPDIWMPPLTDVQYAAETMRVQARLAQRAAVKANVVATHQEVPGVPRVARCQRHLFTLEGKESSLKGMYHFHPTSSHSLPLAQLSQSLGIKFLRDQTNHAQSQAYSQGVSQRGSLLHVPRTFVCLFTPWIMSMTTNSFLQLLSHPWLPELQDSGPSTILLSPSRFPASQRLPAKASSGRAPAKRSDESRRKSLLGM